MLGEGSTIIAEVASRVGWARLWDATMDLGGKVVQGLHIC